MKRMIIFSYGLRPGQVTLETLAAMKRCGAVYTHCLDKRTAAAFSRLAPGLRLTAGLSRKKTASAAAAALRRHDTVGFLTYGNPLFLNQTAAEVMRAAASEGARVEVLAAVSSFDSLVNLFDLNKYSSGGLRLVDAASSVDEPLFTPDMDTLIFVPDILNLGRNAPAKKRFLAAAGAAYPAAAPVYLAACASISGRSDSVIKGTVGGLRALLGRVKNHTIFIPAVR